jgi:hypothetical protein
MIRSLRKFLIAIVPLLLCALRAEAADAFFIESIRVSGVRFASERAIVAESRLRPARAYDEAQLSDAVHRIARLPFVRDADFRLARGSVRDTYVLEILIEETQPIFYSFGHRRAKFAVENGSGDTTTSDEAVVGARWFLGKNSMHVLYDAGGQDRVQAGFTSYGIFGTSASVSLAVGYEPPVLVFPRGTEVVPPFRGSDNLVYTLVGVVPIAGNHSIRASAFQRTAISPRTRVDSGRVVIDLRKYAYRSTELNWVYNTTDDALFPREGTFVTAGVRTTRTTSGHTTSERVQPRTWFDQGVGFTRYWPLSQHQMVRALGQAYTTVDSRDRSYELGGGYSVDFASPRRMRGDDLRFTVIGRTLYVSSQQRSTLTTLSSTLAYRNKWGLMSVGFSYAKYRGLD